MCVNAKTVSESADRFVVMCTIDKHNRLAVDYVTARFHGEAIAAIEVGENWGVTEVLEVLIAMAYKYRRGDVDIQWRKRVVVSASEISITFSCVYVERAHRTPVVLPIADFSADLREDRYRDESERVKKYLD